MILICFRSYVKWWFVHLFAEIVLRVAGIYFLGCVSAIKFPKKCVFIIYILLKINNKYFQHIAITKYMPDTGSSNKKKKIIQNYVNMVLLVTFMFDCVCVCVFFSWIVAGATFLPFWYTNALCLFLVQTVPCLRRIVCFFLESSAKLNRRIGTPSPSSQ